MQKSKLFAFLGILAVFMTLVACPPPAEDTSDEGTQNQSSANDNSPDITPVNPPAPVQAPALSEFVGSWTSTGGDTYVITDTKFISYPSQNTLGTPSVTWTIQDTTGDGTLDTVLYVYGQVTQANTWTYGTMSGSYGAVGHYSAAYLEKIDADTIKISTAYYDSSTDNVSFDYVKANYTDANGAFENKPEYNKVTTKTELSSYIGTWTSKYPYPGWDDWFIINTDNVLVYYANGDPTNDLNYVGVVESTDVSGDDIFLNTKILQCEGIYSNMTVGAYTRIWMQLNENTECKMSTGTVGAMYDTTADTIENLKTKFSFETGAYNGFGEYTKQ
ncbi:MAG: hypothetical protein IKP67_04485 [Spirochaetales bacterium]|nr:hypothetical protein [Spirochaetales bacterium]